MIVAIKSTKRKTFIIQIQCPLCKAKINFAMLRNIYIHRERERETETERGASLETRSLTCWLRCQVAVRNFLICYKDIDTQVVSAALALYCNTQKMNFEFIKSC
jgi:hypothetical protein